MKVMSRALMIGAALALPSAAFAHTGAGAHEHVGFVDGLVHPLTGLDHLAAMLAIGVWSALVVRPAWLAPLAFVVLLAVGALAGFAGVAVPAVEPMIAVSLLVLGLLIATRRGLPMAAAALIAGGFAFFHGAAHGSELAGGGQWLALAGMLGASMALHLSGMALGRLVLSRQRWLPAVSGGGVALLGAVMLARLA